MVTTIQISEKLQLELAKRKIFERETYEEVIWDLIEDTKEISENTKKEMDEARMQLHEGKGHRLSRIKKELGA